MIGEFIEIIKITDIKEREIESFYINPNLNNSERISLVMKKGHLSQKLSLISNLGMFVNDELSLDTFFNLLEDKFLDFEQELQSEIIQKLNKFFTPPYTLELINGIKTPHINILLVLITKSVVNDEKNEKNKFYIDFFNSLVNYYADKKFTIDREFIRYVVSLANFGKSKFSRRYSVIFSAGFTNIIKEFDSELVDRFFRSSTDMENSVRLEIAKGFIYVGKYIKHNTSLLMTLVRTLENYLLTTEDIKVRKETVKCLIELHSTIIFLEIPPESINESGSTELSMNKLSILNSVQSTNMSKNYNEEGNNEKMTLIKEFYLNYLEKTVNEILNDPNYSSKDFLSATELLELRLSLIDTLLSSYAEIQSYNIGVLIKMFFYTNLFFANKMTLNTKIISFALKRFNLLARLYDSPYSPNKQKKLYQIHFQSQSKDNGFADLDIPRVPRTKVVIESSEKSESNSCAESNYYKNDHNENKKNISKNNEILLNLQKSGVSKHNTKSTNVVEGFTFSHDWVTELYKVLLESVFARKIDEEDNQNYNLSLIREFFSVLRDIVDSVEEKYLEFLIDKINKKLEEPQIFNVLIENFETVVDVLINKKSVLENLYCLILEKKSWIIKILCADEDKYEDKDDLEENIPANKFKYSSGSLNDLKDIDSNISNSSSMGNNNANNINNNGLIYSKYKSYSALSIKAPLMSSKSQMEYNRLGYEYKHQKFSYCTNWRVIKSFYASLYKIVPCFPEEDENISCLFNEAFEKLSVNPSYQIQKILINLLVELFKACNKKLREDLIGKVISAIFKSKNFYIRRLAFDFSEAFILKYSFAMFKEYKLVNHILLLFRDMTMANNVVEFCWRIYPFIESDVELKNEFEIELLGLKSCASFKFNNNNTFPNSDSKNKLSKTSGEEKSKIKIVITDVNSEFSKTENSNKSNKSNNEEKTEKRENANNPFNGFCSKSRSLSILTSITNFQAKAKRIYSYVNMEIFLHKDQEKYKMTKALLEKNEESSKDKETILFRVKTKDSSKTNSKLNLKEISPMIRHSQELKMKANKQPGKNTIALPSERVAKKPISSQELSQLSKPVTNTGKVCIKGPTHRNSYNLETLPIINSYAKSKSPLLNSSVIMGNSAGAGGNKYVSKNSLKGSTCNIRKISKDDN